MLARIEARRFKGGDPPQDIQGYSEGKERMYDAWIVLAYAPDASSSSCLEEEHACTRVNATGVPRSQEVAPP